MIILRYLLAIVRGIIVIASMLLFLGGYGLTRIFFKHTRSSGLKLRNLWIRTIGIPVLNIHIKKMGEPMKGPGLFVSNHRSFADPIVMLRFIDALVIAKAEVAGYPIINKAIEVTGIVYVKREKKSSRSAARQAMVDTIKKGYNILVYPEGTVSVEAGPLPFKKGTFIEAAKNGFTVQPMAIIYADPRDLWLTPSFVGQYLKQFGKWRTDVHLHFGPVLQGDDGILLAEQCHQWVESQILK